MGAGFLILAVSRRRPSIVSLLIREQMIVTIPIPLLPRWLRDPVHLGLRTRP
jgi:hypothetical protein